MDEMKIKLEHVDQKISLQVIPFLKELSRRSFYIHLLLWVLILSVWALAGILIAGYVYG